MKMILRTSCVSEDMSWKISFFNSKGIGHSCGSRSFSGGHYYSTNLNAAYSLLFGAWRSNSVKAMLEGLDAKIKWMESMK